MTCPSCRGEGTHEVRRSYHGDPGDTLNVSCSVCDGTGEVDDVVCSKCWKERTENEVSTVHAKFGKMTTQSDMCWKCADNWEPGEPDYDAVTDRERQELNDRDKP